MIYQEVWMKCVKLGWMTALIFGQIVKNLREAAIVVRNAALTEITLHVECVFDV